MPTGEAGLPGARGQGHGGAQEGGGDAGGKEEVSSSGLQLGTSVQRTEQIGAGFCAMNACVCVFNLQSL